VKLKPCERCGEDGMINETTDGLSTVIRCTNCGHWCAWIGGWTEEHLQRWAEEE
jgi:hypothetical protein